MKRLYILSVFISIICLMTNSQEIVKADSYWTTPQSTYEQRRTDFLNYCIENGVKDGLYGIFTQVARFTNGIQPDEAYVQKALEVIKSNRDCNDFTMNGLLRLKYLDKEKNMLPEDTNKKIEDRILDFKYWWNDIRPDTTYRCYHTENHQALYHTAELLAGQLYKDRKFKSGLTGREHIEHAELLLKRWLDFRFGFGFSEWLSSYYEVDILVLANIYDFAEDEYLRTRARMVLDLLMFDLALNNFHGTLGSTSGRIYVSSLITGHHAMSPTLKLVFGEGQYLPENIVSNSVLCSSSYRCPDIIEEIATDYSVDMLNRQKMSIEVDDASKYGLSTDNELDTHLFWGMQEFIHPKVVRMSKEMSNKYGIYPYKNYDDYIREYDTQIERYGKIVNARLDRFALSEANIETYRTSHYMLSCSFDYRVGAPGYQQHIWQANIDNHALVFTNHPGNRTLRFNPNYWAGNASMPRAVQHKNVVICIYNSSGDEGLDFTHAYFPKQAFNEVIQKRNWTFGKKGTGYIALYSQHPTEWQADDKGNINDLIVKGKQNVWICEMGSQKDWGSFSGFVEAISNSVVNCNDTEVTYISPKTGTMKFGWDEPFEIEGKIIPLKTGYRYDNPYSKTKFDSKHVEIKKGKKSLTLNFISGERREAF